ncbi:hypothetical protein AB0B94_16300 [Micromonospora sp. NPDC048986]|uniref:hypothetical protein n=1 Tax=Micromonospora sp. NPDC048986 TaxID=3155644 RepID=UPI003400630C
MAWEWLAPVGAVGGAAVGAMAAVVSARVTARSDVQAQEMQLKILETQIAAQDRRDLFTAKREAYSRFLAEAQSLFDAAIEASPVGEVADEERARQLELLNSCAARLGALAGELAVLGGPEMFGLASEYIAAAYQCSQEQTDSGDLAGARARVTRALHKNMTPDLSD